MKIPFKTIPFWIRALIVIYVIFLVNIHGTLSKQIHLGKMWNEEFKFNRKKEESEIKMLNFNEAWNPRIEKSKCLRKERQEAFERKQQEKEALFSRTEKSFSDMLDQIEKEKTLDNGYSFHPYSFRSYPFCSYPFHQRKAYSAKRWNEEKKRNGEDRKQTVLTQWEWIRDTELPEFNKDDTSSVKKKNKDDTIPLWKEKKKKKEDLSWKKGYSSTK